MTGYRAELEEFQGAVAAWREGGEPQSGQLLDDLTATRERLILAQRSDGDGDVVTGLYRDHDNATQNRPDHNTKGYDVGDEQLSMDLGVEQTTWGKWVDPERRRAQAQKFMDHAGISDIPAEPWPEESPEVKRLDPIVAELFPDLTTARGSDMADAFICFIGECYIKFTGAKWIEWERVDGEDTFYDDVNPALECDTKDEDEISAWAIMNDMINYSRGSYDGMFSYAAAALRDYATDHADKRRSEA
ncbi:hypothetical protein [Nocardia brasiliensis]|uniref:hypothetical protein n=1 Tax=Nocardia brasiliensis TaxID=37326 RepID=UPI0033EC3179